MRIPSSLYISTGVSSLRHSAVLSLGKARPNTGLSPKDTDLQLNLISVSLCTIHGCFTDHSLSIANAYYLFLFQIACCMTSSAVVSTLSSIHWLTEITNRRAYNSTAFAHRWLSNEFIVVGVKKVVHTRLPSMVPELIPVLCSQPAGDVSHKPGVRLPWLSARPAVTIATL